ASVSGINILTSPDGITWTARASGTATVLFSVISTGTQLVAVGSCGTILTSPLDATGIVTPRFGSHDITFHLKGSRLVAALPQASSGQGIRASIYTLTGNKVVEVNANNNGGGISIPIDGLGSGTYFCELKGAGLKIRERFRVSQ
ncbi:MAG: T9SS type A sorting domain-containing protein, partial [Fibrobacteria bacterium]